MAYGIFLVSWPGVEPVPQQWKRWLLTTGLPGNSLPPYLKGCISKLMMVHFASSLFYFSFEEKILSSAEISV